MEDQHWKRTLFALWFANFVAASGMQAIIPFLTFFVEDLGVVEPEARNRWTGILVGAAPIAAAVMGPIWGGIGDRFGRKAMVLRALLAIVVFVGLMSFATALWSMLLLRILQGCFSGFVPPSLTLASVQAPASRQAWVAARIQSAVSAGAVAGYLLGGKVLELSSVRAVFPICAVLAAVAALVVWLGVRDAPPLPFTRPAPRRHVWRSVAGDYRYVFGLPAVVKFLLLVVLVRIAVSFVDPHLARFVGELGGGGFLAGAVFSTESLMLLIFMPIWGRHTDRMGHRRTFALCAAGVAFAYLGQIYVTTVPMLIAFRALNGVFLAGLFPAAYGLAGRESAPERRGSAMGVVFLCLALAHSAGALLGGAILNALGFRALFAAVSAVTAFLAAAVYGLSWWARRHALKVDQE